MGKHKYIESPEKMWEHFQAYRKEVKSKPLLVHDYKGGMATEVRIEKERPLTFVGFELYCFEKGIINDLSDYFANKDGNYSEYSDICKRIKGAIQDDQITGGMAGIYNPSITQRLNNLTERTDVTTNEKEIAPTINVKIVPPTE